MQLSHQNIDPSKEFKPRSNVVNNPNQEVFEGEALFVLCREVYKLMACANQIAFQQKLILWICFTKWPQRDQQWILTYPRSQSITENGFLGFSVLKFFYFIVFFS